MHRHSLRCNLAALVLGAIASTALAGGSGAPGEAPTAVEIAAGSVASSQVVALGRDLVVSGRAAAGVAVVSGSAHVGGEVGGDVVVIGGDVDLLPTARVAGDVFVLGGSIRALPGAEVEGREVAYPTTPGALLILAEGPALGLSPWSRVVVGAKLALLAAWVVTALALVAMAPRPLAETAGAVARAPLRSFVIGLVAVLAVVLAALFLASFLGVAAGVPLLVLLVLAALVLKLWGTIAVCACLGLELSRFTGARGLLAATLVGLALLGALKFVPWLGVWSWSAATLVGVGASLATKLGRREPWLVAE